MAKTPNNFAAPPTPSPADPDYVEMDRFPPRRGNQKEVRRTVAIIGCSLAVLVTGLVLRPMLAPDVPRAVSPPQAAYPPLQSSRQSRASNSTGPIETRIVSKTGQGATAKSGGYSPFDAPSPSTEPDSTPPTDVAITKPYDPFAPSDGSASPRPLASPGAPAAGAASKPTIYGDAQEPPITPSLSRTGGVYQPGVSATPRPGMPATSPFGTGSGTGPNTPTYIPAPIGGTANGANSPASGTNPIPLPPPVTPRFP